MRFVSCQQVDTERCCLAATSVDGVRRRAWEATKVDFSSSADDGALVSPAGTLLEILHGLPPLRGRRLQGTVLENLLIAREVAILGRYRLMPIAITGK